MSNQSQIQLFCLHVLIACNISRCLYLKTKLDLHWYSIRHAYCKICMTPYAMVWYLYNFLYHKLLSILLYFALETNLVTQLIIHILLCILKPRKSLSILAERHQDIFKSVERIPKHTLKSLCKYCHQIHMTLQ